MIRLQPKRRRHALALTVTLLLLACGSSASLAEAEFSERLRRRVANRAVACLETNGFVYGVDFSDSPQRLAGGWAAIEQVETERELARELARVFRSYGVSHLTVLSPEEMEVWGDGEERWAGFRMVPSGSSFLVSMVVPDGPADRVGLRRGDRVTMIDGEPVAERPDAIRGARLRRGADDTRQLSWQRDDESFEARVGFEAAPPGMPIELRWTDRMATLIVNTFRAKAYDREAIDRAFDEIHERDATGLILDLRSNGGGRLSNVLHLLEHLIAGGTTVAWIIDRPPRFKRGDPRPELPTTEMAKPLKLRAKSDVEPYLGPLVVLISGAAGSGGDLTPAVLQDVREGQLIGMRTAGALLGGSWCKLPGGFGMIYPAEEILRPVGSRVEGVGVEPDVALTAEQTVDDDVILGIATRELAGRR